jgi:hypothetical protein
MEFFLHDFLLMENNRILKGSNINISLKNPDLVTNRVNIVVFGGEGDIYTKNTMYFDNIFIHDYYYGFYIPFVIGGSVNDDVYIQNVVVDNTVNNHFVLGVNESNKFY